MRSPSLKTTIGRWALPGLVALSALLLFYDLGGRALWWDEIINVLIDRQDMRGLLTSLWALPGQPEYFDVHPPLFHFIQYAWLRVAGEGDLAVRLPNALFALVALVVVYRIGLYFGGREDKRLAILAALVVAISPFWLLYARMARYYALTALLGALSTWLYLGLLKRPTPAKWIAYFAANVAMLYTDYLVATLLVCQMAYLFWARPSRRWLVTWLAVMALVALAYGPWLPVWRTQSAIMGGIVDADLARSAIGLLLKFGFPMLSYTVGETILPWQPIALAGYVLYAVLAVAGLIDLRRKPGPADWPGARLPFILLFTVIPTLGTIALITFITPTIPFVGVANRTFFAYPFVALLVASGLCAISRPAVRALAIALLVLASGYGIRNYFAGEQFFNPIYAVPTETALSDVLAQAQPGDAIFAEGDIGFDYYYLQQTRRDVPVFPFGQEQFAPIADALKAGRTPPYSRLFVVTFGRDRTRDDPPPAFSQVIQPAARVVWERGYSEQDETYRRIKAALFGREAYAHKLLIQLLEMPR